MISSSRCTTDSLAVHEVVDGDLVGISQRIPSSLSRVRAWTNSALSRSVFDGIVPQLTRVPPTTCSRSTTATRLPARAAWIAARSPPGRSRSRSRRSDASSPPASPRTTSSAGRPAQRTPGGPGRDRTRERVSVGTASGAPRASVRPRHRYNARDALRRKLAWIAVLYFAEGLPFGIAYDVWPVYFRVHGVSLAEIGLMSLLSLPWTWKMLWAPLVDRYGARQQWITACLAALAVATLAIIPQDAAHPSWLLWIVLRLFTTASATQDIAVDAYTVDVSTPERSGPINGMRVSAARVAFAGRGRRRLPSPGSPGGRPLGSAVGALLRPHRSRFGEPAGRTSTRQAPQPGRAGAALAVALGDGAGAALRAACSSSATRCSAAWSSRSGSTAGTRSRRSA